MEQSVDDDILLEPSSRRSVDENVSVAIERFYTEVIATKTRFTVTYVFHRDARRKEPVAAPFQLLLLVGFFLGAFVFLTLVLPSNRSKCLSFRARCLHSKETEVPPPLVDARAMSRRSFPKDRELLFVGVMTSKSYADTRVPALYHTWGQRVPGKLTFFSAEDQPKRPDLPMVNLPGVDDSYPPQKKSFTMIKFMYDNHLDDFEWFARADDDVFFKLDELSRFLRSINSSKPWYIGHPGQGNRKELGKLNLDVDENYCLGGPGMILSRETLARVGPHVRDCLHRNIFSTHEDVEIGRCVRKYAGINCTWNYEMANMFYHNGTYKESFAGDLDPILIERAVALHPVKIPALHYRLLDRLTAQKIERLRHKAIRLKRAAVGFSELTTAAASRSEVAGIFRRKTGDGYFDREEWRSSERNNDDWMFFDRWSVSSARNLNPRVAPGDRLKSAFKDAVDQLLLRLNVNAHLRGRAVELKRLNFGYSKHVPFPGVDYVLNLKLTHRRHLPKKKTFTKKWVGRVRRSFAELEFREIQLPASKRNDEASRVARERHANRNGVVSSVLKLLRFSHPPSSRVPPLEPINFVVTLAGRLDNFKRFVSYWEAACFPAESCTITVVLFSTGDPSRDRRGETEEFFDSVRERRRYSVMRLVRAKGAFSRGIGVELGASFYPLDALLFICDVDLVVTSDLLDRIRRGTERNKRVYYPIMYSEFDSSLTFPGNNDSTTDVDFLRTTRSKEKKSKFDSNPLPFAPGWNESVHCFNDAHLGDVTGYWRQFSFGMVAIYNSDLRRSGGFDLSIQGWGKEDTDLAEKVLRSGLEMFRVADVGLYHVYHRIRCDRSLPNEQLVQCLNTQLQTWLSRKILARLLLPVKDDFSFRPDVSADIVP